MKEAEEILTCDQLEDEQRTHLINLSHSLLRAFPQSTGSSPYLNSLLGSFSCSSPAREFAATILISLLDTVSRDVAKWVIEDEGREEILLENLDSRTVAELMGGVVSVETGEESILIGISRILQRIASSICSSPRDHLPNSVLLLSDFISKCEKSNWLHRFQPLVTLPLLSSLTRSLSSLSEPHLQAALDVLTVELSSPLMSAAIAESESLRNALPALCEETLPTLKNLLEQTSPDMVRSQIGEDYPRLGTIRLASVHLLAAFSALPFCSLASSISKSAALRLCTDLFFEYDWHSLLHHSYYRTVRNLMSSSSEIQLLVITETGLPHHLVSIDFLPVRGGKAIRPGHIGFVSRLSNLIQTASHSSFFIHAVLMEVDGWSKFVKECMQPLWDEEEKAKEMGVTRQHSGEIRIPMIDELLEMTPLLAEEDDEDFELKEDGN